MNKTYLFLEDTPYGKKGDKITEIKNDDIYASTYKSVGGTMSAKELFFLIKLGVVEDGEWKPKDGEVFYYITEKGTVDWARDNTYETFLGKFKLKEEAEKRLFIIKEYIKSL